VSYSPPPTETETYFGRLPWIEAQAKLSETAPEPSGIRRAEVGWHGTLINRETGSFAVVRTSGPFGNLIGERIKLTVRGTQIRSVCVYVNGSTDRIPVDLSLTRRAFLALALLSSESIYANLEVLS
jgi:hypothetical protein